MLEDKESQSGPLRHMRGYCPETKTWISIRVNEDGEIVIDPITPDKINIETKARAYLGTDQLNLTNGTWTKVLLDTESYDIGDDFDTDNNKFIAPVTGYYVISGQVAFMNVIANKRYAIAIRKNATSICEQTVYTGIVGHTYSAVSDIIYLSTNDEVTLYAISLAGVNTVDIGAGSHLTYLAIHLLSV